MTHFLPSGVCYRLQGEENFCGGVDSHSLSTSLFTVKFEADLCEEPRLNDSPPSKHSGCQLRACLNMLLVLNIRKHIAIAHDREIASSFHALSNVLPIC